MFFGFGWAVLGGFLLTSTKNWVQIRGYHGAALAFLAAAWLFERAGMGSAALAGLAVPNVEQAVPRQHRRHAAVDADPPPHQTDSYRDNYFFLLILPAFLVAKQLMLTRLFPGRHRHGHRPVPRRLPGDAGTHPDPVHEGRLPGRHPAPCGAGRSIKLLGLALVAAPAWLPPPLGPLWPVAAAGVLLAGRLMFWHPHLALRRLDIGIMYLGYAGIVLQLLLEASARWRRQPGSAPCRCTSSASA
jgi:uncharacterized protein involved in response to NO